MPFSDPSHLRRVTTYLAEVPAWPDYSTILTEEKQKFDELVSAKNLGTDDESNIFKPGQQYVFLQGHSPS